uniref:Reverse transcriptase Ty1/copia-type domain-containing protein n=1 Tax=Vitis vinifera TaxID=29760 RepID=A5BR29_VITVI|nr:hypothetical protein VITISV_033404 [Vitis vinifera]
MKDLDALKCFMGIELSRSKQGIFLSQHKYTLDLLVETDIEIANDSVQNDPTKHIDLDKNYIKDNLDFDMIKVPYIKNADQLVDMMTYVVTSGAFYVSLSKLGMCDNYVPT